MVPVKIDSMSAFTALTQDLHVEGPLLLKLNRGFAPAAKVCFPPLSTESAYGPKLPLKKKTDAASQPAIADIDTAPQ